MTPKSPPPFRPSEPAATESYPPGLAADSGKGASTTSGAATSEVSPLPSGRTDEACKWCQALPGQEHDGALHDLYAQMDPPGVGYWRSLATPESAEGTGEACACGTELVWCKCGDARCPSCDPVCRPEKPDDRALTFLTDRDPTAAKGES